MVKNISIGAPDPVKYIALSDKNKFEITIYPDSTVKINGKKMELSIEEGSDGFNYVIYGNKKYPIEIVENNQNRYGVNINGVSYKMSVETPISYKRKKHLDKIGGSSKHEDVIAPMPGKIIELIAEEGTKIKENDPVLILEAMKMENEIRSHVSGTIKKINIKPGDIVMKDDILIEIEK